jgi:RNA polymerase sigma factor (sigma-70 family)
MTVAEYNKSVDDYSDGLFRFILKNLGRAEQAEDIVQDTYEKLWMRVSLVDHVKVKSYLYTTAYHTMIDYLRREKRFSDISGEIDIAADNVHYSGVKEALDKAVSLLPPDQRSVILLRDYEGYSYDEIAGITGLSESQVKVYIFRGRLFLKNYIGNPEAII